MDREGSSLKRCSTPTIQKRCQLISSQAERTRGFVLVDDYIDDWWEISAWDPFTIEWLALILNAREILEDEDAGLIELFVK